MMGGINSGGSIPGSQVLSFFEAFIELAANPAAWRPRLKELRELLAENQRILDETKVRAEKMDALHAAQQTAAEHQATRTAALDAQGAGIVAERAELDRQKADFGARVAELHAAMAEVATDRAALAAERAAFDRAKKNLAELVM